jgi:hypothetical protein
MRQGFLKFSTQVKHLKHGSFSPRKSKILLDKQEAVNER